MQKKYNLIVLIMSLTLQTAWSQKEYQPGYVVLNTKDTLFGEIQDRNIKKGELFTKIRFKSENKKRKKYSANDILSYKVGNTVFESKWFDEEANLFQIRYDCIKGVGEKVFLRLNVKGKVSCYTREFTEQGDQLINGFELFLKRGSKHFQRANQGLFGLKRNQLSTYFKDCPELVSNLNNKKFKYAFELAYFYNDKCE